MSKIYKRLSSWIFCFAFSLALVLVFTIIAFYLSTNGIGNGEFLGVFTYTIVLGFPFSAIFLTIVIGLIFRLIGWIGILKTIALWITISILYRLVIYFLYDHRPLCYIIDVLGLCRYF